MPIKTIKHIKELPSWFKLGKYDVAKILDATGWYEQLSARRNLKLYVDRDIHDGSPSSLQTLEVLEALRATPIIDVKSNLLVNVLLAGGSLEELKSGSPRYSLGVHMTTVREHYLAEGNIEDEKRTYARNFFAQIFSGDLFKEPYVPLKYTCKDWIDEPIDFIKSNQSLDINLTVDISLPDSVLIEQFKLFLREMRSPLKQAGISIDNKLRPDFDGWAKFGVLPYLDLSLWAEVEGLKIPNRVMADAIFPRGEGGEEVVRKTTQKLAYETLTESHLNKLAALAAHEIAERNAD
ncbi:MAG: DUF6387 family protein [Methylotenera sp.]|nr:DUF6387 family protein [Methylotenera sp.]